MLVLTCAAGKLQRVKRLRAIRCLTAALFPELATRPPGMAEVPQRDQIAVFNLTLAKRDARRIK